MPVTFSFGGAGNQFPYLMGIAHGLRTHFPLDWSQVKVHCISSGCSGAIALLLCTPSQIDELVEKGIYASQTTPHRPSEDYFKALIKSMLPYNAYQLLDGNLSIGQTSSSNMGSIFVSGKYQSQTQLVETMYDSCRIPFITGGTGEMIDGGFSHQYAVYDENTIVLTLKRKRQSDIYLKKYTFFTEILFVSGDEMRVLYEQGKEAVRVNLEMLRGKVERGMMEGEGEGRWMG
jgi:hypothetical protein